MTRMAAERAEHEQARARMPLLPPVLRGFGGRLARRVLHGVDVLFGHRALRGVDVLGRRVKRGADVRLCHHGTTVLRALADAAATAPCRCERWRQRCVSRGSGTVHRKTERDGMMGLLNALYCGKVASMIFPGNISHTAAQLRWRRPMLISLWFWARVLLCLSILLRSVCLLAPSCPSIWLRAVSIWLLLLPSIGPSARIA